LQPGEEFRRHGNDVRTGHRFRRRGKPVIRKSRDWVSDKTFHGEKVLGPYFNGPNQFAVHFSLDITPNATGKRITLQEVGVYTVNKDDKITREQFFYDGEH
jgi:SnoaL-like protein